MMTLEEFLGSLASEARDHAERRRDERHAQLISELKAWITGSDPERLLRIGEGSIFFFEGEVHEYTLPSLQISLGRRRVTIVPARRDAAEPGFKPTEGGVWADRVDMKGDSRSFELWGFMIGRHEHRWYIRDGRDGSIRPLTGGSFGYAMVELFSQGIATTHGHDA